MGSCHLIPLDFWNSMLFRGSKHIQLHLCPQNLADQSQSSCTPPWHGAVWHSLVWPVCSLLSPCRLCCEQPESETEGSTSSYFYSILNEFRSWKPKIQPQVSKVFSWTSRRGSWATGDSQPQLRTPNEGHLSVIVLLPWLVLLDGGVLSFFNLWYI